MNYLRKIISKLILLCRSKVGMKNSIYKIENDIPELIETGLIYLIKDKYRFWLAVFKCPCGCGEEIKLNLIKEASPSWNINLDKQKKISISPSIWRKIGCKSHFTVRKNIIIWH